MPIVDSAPSSDDNRIGPRRYRAVGSAFRPRADEMSYCTHCGTRVDDGVRRCPNCGKPPAGARASVEKTKIHPLAIVAVVVVAVVGALMIFGIIAAIAVPNLLNAIDRGKQKRTLADLRTLANAVEAYSVDKGAYPSATTITELKGVLVPEYIEVVPTTDGWGHTFIVEATPTAYTLCSGGKDGGPCTVSEGGGPTGSFDDAIILSNGQFVQWPEGMQR